MTREQVKELLPFLQAFANGEPIQALCNNEWRNMGNDPDIDPNFCKYRIKPRLKYRPFNDYKECWEEMQKHAPFGWVKFKKEDLYTNYYNVSDSNNFKLEFKEYIFVDGEPFGIKEQKEE